MFLFDDKTDKLFEEDDWYEKSELFKMTKLNFYYANLASIIYLRRWSGILGVG